MNDKCFCHLNGFEVKDAFSRRKLKNICSTPQEYGAKGDGETDDTTAIQNCINENNTIFFPVGNYKITEPLKISYGKTIYGENKYNTRIYAENCDAVHFIITKNKDNQNEYPERTNIKGLSFWGDESTHKTFVFNLNAVHITFNDIWIRHFGDTYFYNNGSGHINNIIIQNSELERGGNNCIEFLTSNESQINNININNCNISTFANDGICITGNNITITGCTIQAVKYGIVIDPEKSIKGGACSSSGLIIMGNYFEQISKSYISLKPYYETDKTGFINGVNIIGNFGTANADNPEKREDETLFPAIEIKPNKRVYQDYGVNSRSMISGIIYAGNKLNVNSEKVLIDGGGALQSDCIIIADGVSGGNSSAKNPESIFKNMCNATIYSRYEYHKKELKLYEHYIPEGATVTHNSVTIGNQKTLFINLENPSIHNITFNIKGVGSAVYSSSLDVFLHVMEDDELKRKKVENRYISVSSDGTDNTITFNETSFTKGSIGTTNYNYKDVVQVEFVISSGNNELTITNPIIKYVK